MIHALIVILVILGSVTALCLLMFGVWCLFCYCAKKGGKHE